MVKSKDDTIAEFNEQVNMTVEELEEWLENPMSKKAGTGVGLESAQKIIEILKKNPSKDPAKYEDEDLDHMRKVVGYNKRHIAQEEHLKDTKTKEELEKTKSTISLKNWGHDPIKTLEEDEDTEAQEEETEGSNEKNVKADKLEDEEKAESTEKDIGSKRKHDEVADDQAEDPFQNADGEDVFDEDSDDTGEDAPEEGEERARKKSKTAADEAT